MNAILDKINKRYVNDEVPEVRGGDKVRVHVRIKEGDKERIQVFEGHVIAVSGEGTRRTFTVRKMSSGIGVERIFPIHSPRLAKIEMVGFGRVRRAKLYYLRDRIGKSARIRTKKKRNGRI